MEKYFAEASVNELGGVDSLDVENLALGRITRLVVEAGLRAYKKHSHVPLDLFLADYLNEHLEAARMMRPDLQHRCQLPEGIQEALNSGDGTYRP